MCTAFSSGGGKRDCCEERTCGIRFNIMDVTLCADASLRGAEQIVPFTRRCHPAAELTYTSTEIACRQETMSDVSSREDIGVSEEN